MQNESEDLFQVQSNGSQGFQIIRVDTFDTVCWFLDAAAAHLVCKLLNDHDSR